MTAFVIEYVEYGVLLGDGATVAPAADHMTALAYALNRGLTIAYRRPGQAWRTVAPSAAWKWAVDVDCTTTPGHRTRKRHERRGEPLCRACRTWDAAYRRQLRQRGRAAA